MKIKDVQVGKPYFYENGKYQSESLVVVLDTSTLLRTRTIYDAGTHARFIPHTKGMSKPDASRTGYLALKLGKWGASKLTPEQVSALSAVTANQVALDGFKVPARLRELGIEAELTLIQVRALVGDWEEIAKARKEAKEAAEARVAERDRQNTLRIERWERVFETLRKLKGEERSSYYVSEFGEGPRKEIALEDMELLIGLAEYGMPSLRAEEPVD